MTPARDAHRPTADGREELAGSRLPVAGLLLREERKGGGGAKTLPPSAFAHEFLLIQASVTSPGNHSIPLHSQPCHLRQGCRGRDMAAVSAATPHPRGCEAQRQGSVFTTFLSRHQIRGPHTYTVTAKEMLARPDR